MIDAHLIPRSPPASGPSPTRVASPSCPRFSGGETRGGAGRGDGPPAAERLAAPREPDHAGLVEARRDGNRVFYRIADPTVLRICDAVCDSLVARAREEKRQAVEARRRRRAGGER